MFACPQCQFENPASNRFCQRCGSPLKPLRAILVKGNQAAASSATGPTTTLQAPSGNASEAVPPPTAAAAATSSPVRRLQDFLVEGRYLDDQKRYQVRSPVDLEQPLTADMELAVLDSQPTQPSPLATPQAAIADTAEASNDPAIAANLPPFAQPYWVLQEKLFPTIPELQAAWLRQDYGVLILEDRGHWTKLTDAWTASRLDPLERIHWLYEMTELWEALTPWQGQPSLLNQDNLRLDDDQILCLRRLYRKGGDARHSLQDLGLLWQALLQQCPQESSFESLMTLAAAMVAGDITDVTTIKEQLAEIADAQQSSGAEDAESAAPAAPPGGNTTIAASANLPPSPAEILSDEELLLSIGRSDDDDEVGDTEPLTSADEGDMGELPTMALPVQLYRLEEAGRTHVGRQRNHNEDSFYAQTQLQKVDSPEGTTLSARGLYILCDGMGGHASGEVASNLAVSTLHDYFEQHWGADLPAPDGVRAAIAQANQNIFDKNEADDRSGSGRMGTTLVLVLLQDTQALVAHVGDSRLYCLTRRGLQQMTVDHEVGQQEIQRGVDPAIAYANPNAYQLTQALGPRGGRELSPSVSTFNITEDMLLLLCSDGLSDNELLETHLESHVQPLLRSRHDLEDGVSQLIELANEHNGHDNITVVAVRLKVRPRIDAFQGLG